MKVRRPQIMGILNVTPDSFSDGGQLGSIDAALTRAHDMVAHGADIIDIGGESTRPGANHVSPEDELERVLPVVRALHGDNLGAKISIDTRHAHTAKACIDAGASIWNDVSALTHDENSAAMAAQLGCTVVLMHMKGRPKTMQDSPEYENVTVEVCEFLKQRVQAAINAGVEPANIILDPGIGFGKQLDDNLDLLAHIDDFYDLACPVLIGTSRKSFIGMIDDSDVENRLGGSVASALWATSLGASYLRVHDVAQTVQAVKIWQAIRGRV